MDNWRRNTPRDVGYQRTDMSLFGFADGLRDRFRFYMDRFDVQTA
jgi:hypothetical protein